MAGFEAALTAWAKKTEGRMTAVFRLSAQQLANDVRISKGNGGNMPVDTGNLRNSLAISASEPIQTSDAAAFADGSANITATITNSKLGDTLYLGFQAKYARRMEYGFRGVDSAGRNFDGIHNVTGQRYQTSGNGFVRKAAKRWKTIVRNAAKQLQAAYEARR